MKYLCLIYADESALAALPEPAWRRLDRDCLEYGEMLAARGQCLARAVLRDTSSATTIRSHDGRISLRDGPYAETREQLAGFYLIEAADLDQAIRLAAGIPPARMGCVEVRPLRER